ARPNHYDVVHRPSSRGRGPREQRRIAARSAAVYRILHTGHRLEDAEVTGRGLDLQTALEGGDDVHRGGLAGVERPDHVACIRLHELEAPAWRQFRDRRLRVDRVAEERGVDDVALRVITGKRA